MNDRPSNRNSRGHNNSRRRTRRRRPPRFERAHFKKLAGKRKPVLVAATEIASLKIANLQKGTYRIAARDNPSGTPGFVFFIADNDNHYTSRDLRALAQRAPDGAYLFDARSAALLLSWAGIDTRRLSGRGVLELLRQLLQKFAA